jgi:hypothetical protein
MDVQTFQRARQKELLLFQCTYESTESETVMVTGKMLGDIHKYG